MECKGLVRETYHVARGGLCGFLIPEICDGLQHRLGDFFWFVFVILRRAHENWRTDCWAQPVGFLIADVRCCLLAPHAMEPLAALWEGRRVRRPHSQISELSLARAEREREKGRFLSYSISRDDRPLGSSFIHNMPFSGSRLS